MHLLNNYEANTNEEEVLTEEELKEEEAFINSIMKTSLVKAAHKYI